jgi:hypothetical protein
VFALRAISFGTGLGTLVALDIVVDRVIDMESTQTRPLIGWTVAFWIVTVIKDSAFIVPKQTHFQRHIVLAVLQVLQLAIAIFSRIFFTGHAFTACVMVAVYEFDYRQGRHFWSQSVCFIKPKIKL